MKTLSTLLLALLLTSPVFGQGVLVPTFDDLPDTTELLQRIEALEVAVQKLSESIPSPGNPGEPTVDPPTTEAHAHFNSLLNRPELLKAWSLRQQSDYSNMRGGRFPDGINPLAHYDESIDAGKISLPPRRNEITGIGGFVCDWGKDYQWKVGNKLVVQHDYMVSETFHRHAGDSGTNGRKTNGFKFTNLLRNGSITYENRIWLLNDPTRSAFDVRAYVPKGEGRQERDEIASDVASPSRTYFGKGGGYDRHPGPDSSWQYGQIQLKHPDTFMIHSDKWVRITYELTHVEEGTRLKVWLADEDTEPKLIIASPIDPTMGFLLNSKDIIHAWYMELDTSQETNYAEDMPDRWIGMRNLVVLHDVDGDEVLGGRPIR